MENKKVLKKSSNMVTRKIDDETILLPLYRTSGEIDCIFTLDEISSRIWELIDGRKNLGRIKAMLLNEFDVSEKKLNKDLAIFLNDLIKIKAVS